MSTTSSVHWAMWLLVPMSWNGSQNAGPVGSRPIEVARPGQRQGRDLVLSDPAAIDEQRGERAPLRPSQGRVRFVDERERPQDPKACLAVALLGDQRRAGAPEPADDHASAAVSRGELAREGLGREVDARCPPWAAGCRGGAQREALDDRQARQSDRDRRVRRWGTAGVGR
jgi:hypothetical protein